jgi:uncharacterized MAPEG superfamily protein
MPVEVTMLLYALLLLFVMVITQAMMTLKTNGFMRFVGSRDSMSAEISPLNGRLSRAINNYKENLFYFIPLILLAVSLDVSNSHTVWGAQVFVIARVGFALAYLTGLPFIRSPFFAVGIIGCGMIAYGLYQ